jgi:hypothetical protein
MSMIVEFPFEYEAVVRMPRSRYDKSVLLREMVPVDVRTVGSQEAPVAVRAPKAFGTDPMPIDHRAFEGRFFAPVSTDRALVLAEEIGESISEGLWTSDDVFDVHSPHDVRSIEWSARAGNEALFVERCAASLLSVDGVLHERIDPPIATMGRIMSANRSFKSSRRGDPLPACAWDLASRPDVLAQVYAAVGSDPDAAILEIPRPDLLVFDRERLIVEDLACAALDVPPPPEIEVFRKPAASRGPFDTLARLQRAVAAGEDIDHILSLVEAVWKLRAKSETVNAQHYQMIAIEGFKRNRHVPDPRAILPLPAAPAAGMRRTAFKLRHGGYADVHVVEVDVPDAGETLRPVATISVDGHSSSLLMRDDTSFLASVSDTGIWGGRGIPLRDPRAPADDLPEWSHFCQTAGLLAKAATKETPDVMDLDTAAAQLRKIAAERLAVVDGMLHRRVHEPLITPDEKHFALRLDTVVAGEDGRPSPRGQLPRGLFLALSESDLLAPLSKLLLDPQSRPHVLPDIIVHKARDLVETALPRTAIKLLEAVFENVRTSATGRDTTEALDALASLKRAANRLERNSLLTAAIAAPAAPPPADPACGIPARRAEFAMLADEIVPRLLAAALPGIDLLPDEDDQFDLSM